MKEDDLATNESTPSKQELETKHIKTSSQLSDKVLAKAYKLKRLRKQARNNQIKVKQ